MYLYGFRFFVSVAGRENKIGFDRPGALTEQFDGGKFGQAGGINFGF